MKQRGFTLIELVVVIVILGILAATALPKFVDLAGDARASVMRGVEAAMRGANTMLYAKAAAQSQLGATGSVSTNGATVALVYGYAKDITELVKVLDLNPSNDFNPNNGALRIEHKNAPNFATTPQNCAVGYTAATSATAPAVVASATVTGC